MTDDDSTASELPYTTEEELSERELTQLDIEDQIRYAIYNGNYRIGDIVEVSAFSKDWTTDIVDDMVEYDDLVKGTDQNGPFYMLPDADANSGMDEEERAKIHANARREYDAETTIGDTEDIAARRASDTGVSDDAYASAGESMTRSDGEVADPDSPVRDDAVEADAADPEDVREALAEHGGLLPVDRRYDWSDKKLDPADVPEYISSNGEYDDIVREIETRRETGKLPHFNISGPTGCHAPGQEVLMYDGTTKAVENVEVGDELMGPDSEPREVLSLTSGTDEMYEVQPTKGEPFTVNSQHRLSLIRTNDGTSKAGDIVDPTIEEWLEWSDTHKHIHKLFRRPADFDTGHLTHPYVLGVLIGDGSLTDGTVFHAESPAVIETVEDRLDTCSLTVADHPSSGAAKKCYINTPGSGPTGEDNPVLSKIRNWGLDVSSEEKFIPDVAKRASRPSRQKLLGGLIDSNGWVEDGRAEYYTKSDRLAADIAFVARSLGFAAYVSDNETPENGTHNRVAILGDMSELATRHESKQGRSRSQKKSVLRTGFDVEYVGEGEYYGFTVDGDNRYLLDDFTVTHNCGKTTLAERIAVDMDAPVFEIHCHEGLRPSNLLGMPTYVGDETWWIDGPVPKALLSSQEQPTVVILDEVNRTSSRVLGVLMSMLDHQARVTLDARGGETVQGDPMNLIVFSTMNEGEGYVVNSVDTAQKRRLGNKYYTDYIGMDDPTAESDLMADRTPISREIAIELVEAANDIRAKADSDSAVSMGVPTDTMLDWAATAWAHRDSKADKGPLVKAAERAVLNKFYRGDDREEDTVRSIIESHLEGMGIERDDSDETSVMDSDVADEDDTIDVSDETYLMCESCGWYAKAEDADDEVATTMSCPECSSPVIPKDSS